MNTIEYETERIVNIQNWESDTVFRIRVKVDPRTELENEATIRDLLRSTITQDEPIDKNLFNTIFGCLLRSMYYKHFTGITIGNTNISIEKVVEGENHE